jgi:integrase
MPSIYRPKGRRKWYILYTDAQGRRHHVAGYRDRALTWYKAMHLYHQVERERAGLVSPAEKHLQRPIQEHLSDFQQSLQARENTPRHVHTTLSQVKTILEACHVASIGDISPANVMNALAEFRRAGMGIVTANHYLVSIKAFSAWLVRNERSDRDLLAHLQRLANPETDRRRIRRALSPDEFADLIEATARAGPFRGLSGQARVMLYLVAAYTGLRASELASLTPRSFNLQWDPPTVTVQAAYSKHRRQDVLPLHPDIASRLASYLPGCPEDPPGLAWPGTWSTVAAKMIRKDLAAAEVPYRDDAGQTFDFHALRHHFITHLARSGIHPKAAQSLARHSTITLTLDHYSHLVLSDMTAAVERLPILRRESKAKGEATTGGERAPARASSVPRLA